MWLNQTVQSQNKSSLSATNSKFDCAKECPCGVPTIPVPDQWLEVMVTGGFKVWHIIFIIIAFIVTMIVIYCCFHRCRIPRTKQEIEADLMRSNLGNKFRDYLQELPNEPFTFAEALKKVQEIEKKLEQDDAELSRELGARKRMGWIKLKGKEKDTDKEKNKDKDADKQDGGKPEGETETEPTKAVANGAQLSETALVPPGPETTNQTNRPLNGQSKVSGVQPEVVAGSDEVTRENKLQADREAEPDKAGGEDKLPAKVTTTKRRRQKPNLSRTKLAKERPLMAQSSDNLERPAESSSHLELPDPTSRPHKSARAHKKKLRSDKTERIEPHSRPGSPLQ